MRETIAGDSEANSFRRRKELSLIDRIRVLPILLLILSILMSGGPRTILVLMFSKQPYGQSITLPVTEPPVGLSEKYGKLYQEQARADFESDRTLLWAGGIIGLSVFLASLALSIRGILNAESRAEAVLPVTALMLAIAVSVWAISQRSGTVDLSTSFWI